MSLWGKIIGGAAGFALGGPLGALIGAVAGHAVDRMRAAGPSSPEEARQAAFATGVIVLAAKMAKADGRVTRDEVATFKRVFRVPPHAESELGALFNEARREASGYEPYARQLAWLFRDSPHVLEQLLAGLVAIARADGVVGPAEGDYLRRVAAIFGLDEAAFERVHAGQAGPEEADPYAILGVSRGASDREIKASYRRQVRQHHPDRLVAQGMPQDFIDVANDKLAAINAAYDRIARERGLR